MPRTPRPRLLIIEDNPELTALLDCVASSLGFVCTAASDQATLTSALAESHPDLLVLDLQLPDTDGIEVLRDLRARLYSGPIVLVSGHAPRTLRAAETVAREQGLQVRGTLHKPFSMGRFRELLAEIPALQYGFPFPADNRVDESRLRRAIDAGQLAPWLQPQFDLVDGSLHGFEMLARWQHDDGSLTSPVDFIPVAERNGLIDSLTFSLLSELLEHLPSVARRNPDWRLSINISPDSLLELDFPERLSACFKAAGFDPRRITLEITESRLLHNLGASLDVLTRLSLRGFAISIDDFGTGYSTLGQLARLPCSEVKIDRGFVHALFTDSNAEVIVRKTVEMGQELGMLVLAEGVEEINEYRYLQSLGCHLVQGNLTGSAVPAPGAFSRLHGYSGERLSRSG